MSADAVTLPVLDVGVQTSPYDTRDVTDHTTARVRLHERALGGRENRRHHRHDQSIDVLCLCETWHDEDSVSIRRQQVLERARPRSASELSTLSTNHRTMPHGTECRLCRVAGNAV